MKTDTPADEFDAAEKFPLFFDFSANRATLASPDFTVAMQALTPKHASFVKFYLESCSGTDAARKAGYAERSAAQEATRLLKRLDVRAAVDEAHATLADAGIYDLQRAMAEAAAGIRFAEATSNANAAAKLIEHRARLNGLLVGRVEIATVNFLSVNDQAADLLGKIRTIDACSSALASPEAS
jgi:hypothetical protein